MTATDVKYPILREMLLVPLSHFNLLAAQHVTATVQQYSVQTLLWKYGWFIAKRELQSIEPFPIQSGGHLPQWKAADT